MFEINIKELMEDVSPNLQIYANSNGFQNENNFKSELFHHICCKKYNNVSFGEQYPGSKTCIAHCEAKVENGTNAIKADLIFCDPSAKMQGAGSTFNYQVTAVFELKKTFSKIDIENEINKYHKYNKKNEQYFFIDPYRDKKISAELLDYVEKENIKYITFTSKPKCMVENYNYKVALDSVYSAIGESLYLYGKNNSKFQSFYWCNYEWGTVPNLTYPSEGDFNAHLYHRLKTKMPYSHIETEFSVGKNKRIDIVLLGPNKEWCIPIEVKMNWDQFKRNKNEAETILNRFDELQKLNFKKFTPILIVIQGDIYSSIIYPPVDSRNNKHNALSYFNKSNSKITILSYNESTNQVGSPTSK